MVEFGGLGTRGAVRVAAIHADDLRFDPLVGPFDPPPESLLANVSGGLLIWFGGWGGVPVV